MKPRLKMRLGDLLVQETIITEAQLQQALAEQRNTGKNWAEPSLICNRLPNISYCSSCRNN